MNDEPDIIKELRKEERLGKLKSQSASIHDIQEKQESFNEEDNDTFYVFENDFKNGEEKNIILGNLEEKYRTIFENYAVGITIVDENERIVSWNKYAEELFNMDEKELHLRHVRSLYPPDEWRKIREHNIRQKGMKYKLETKMIRNGKKPFDAEVSLCILRGAGGRITGSVGIIRDITRLKVTERKLLESEEKYRTIFENSAVAIMLTNENEKIISWNKYAEVLLNMSEEDLNLRPVKSLYPEKEWKKIRSQNVRQKGMQHHLETMMIKKNDVLINVDISISVLKNHEGEIIGSIGVIRDITERKKAENKLKESEARYRTIFDNSAVAIMLTDENEKIISWNKYAENMLQMNEADLYMKPVSFLYSPEEWQKIRKENVRRKGMQHHLETKILRKNDQPLDVDVSLSVLKNHNGEIIGSIGVIKDISERKIIQARLSYEKNLLQSLLDSIPDSIYFKDKESRFIKVNKAKAAHSNTTVEKMTEKTDFDFLSEKNAKKIHEDDKKVMETGEPIVNKIEKITDKNGVERWISVTKIPRYDERGNIIGTAGISRDITELKKAEDIVRKSERRYRRLFETAIDPIIVLDPKGFFVDINERVTKLLGYSKKDLIGKRFDKIGILSKGSAEKTRNNFKRRIAGEDIGPYEVKIVAKTGEMIPAEVNANPLYDDKKVIGDLIILRDIRERFSREIAEKDLVESEKKFREIFDATGDFLLYIDVNGSILDVNKTALKLMGLEKEKFLGKGLSVLKNLFSSENIKKHIESVDKTAQGEDVREYESELVTKDGIKYRFLFSTDVIKKEEKITGILFRGRDITQRQRAWDELVKLEEKYRVLAETSADGVITIDSLGRLTYVNPSFENICGRRKSQILATLLRDYLSDDSIYLFQQVFIDTRKKDEKVENIELELVHSDGKLIPIDANIAPLYKNDKFAGVICTVRDITERKKVEEELKKSERLKTEFMNIAAHELKSPVTPIKGYLDLIISDNNSSDKIREWAKISQRNAERLLRLVNDILDVSRLDTDTMRFNMEKLSSVEILEEIVEDMKAVIEQKGLEFIVHIPKNLPDVIGDRYRLSQVFKNLLGNAIKFTDNGSIALVAKEEDKHILISVEDSGIGISKEELKKIFTKFYQAYTGDDRKNEGTGLGLFICKQIIEKHNGEIWAESNIPQGSTFRMKIPHL